MARFALMERQLGWTVKAWAAELEWSQVLLRSLMSLSGMIMGPSNCFMQLRQHCRRALSGLVAMTLALLLVVAPAAADDTWSLQDEAGHRFRTSLFEQPYPEYPAGWRLRFNALDGGIELDHSDALQLSDAMGQRWTLPNRSEEIVPPDGTPIPAGSAQFDLGALSPRPSDALPLRLTLTSREGPLSIDLNPEQTEALHDLA
jgi:hypothetical protein